MKKMFDMSENIQKNEGKKRGFWKDNRGVGVIEVVLILVVLIGLVLIFKDQISSVVTNALSNITGDAGSIMG